MVLILAAALMCQEPTQQPEKPEKEVVIIGTRSESDVLDVPSGVTVITREEIQRRGVTNIVEALQTSPSFFPQGPNKNGADALADLRGYNNGGGNGQRTLVLVDGRRTNGVTNSATDWGSIPLNNIERIEIVRGPGAALYGDPALAGVINIITRRGKKDETRWRTRVAGGTFDTLEAGGEAFGGWNDLTYSVSAGDVTTDGWRSNSRYEGVDATGKFDYALSESWKAYLKVGFHDDDRRRPGTLTQTEIDTLGRNATVKPNDDAHFTDYNGDLAFTHTSKELGEFSAQFTQVSGESRSKSEFFGSFFTTEDQYDQSALYLKDVVDVDLLGLTWKLTIGVDLVYENAESLSGTGAQTRSDYTRRTIGTFGHVEVRPIAGLIVSGSVRWDRALLSLDRDVPAGGFGDSVDETKDFDQVSPAVGVTYHLFDELSVYAGYGRPFKYPTRDELIGFTVSDPQLVPERAHSYEIGTRFWSGRWGSASVAYYRMDVKDEIYFDPTFGFFGANINFEDVRHQGIESELRFTALPRDDEFSLDLFASYTYTRAVIQSDGLEGKRYPVTPAHMGNAGFTARYDNVFLTVADRVVGRRYLIGDTTNSFDQMEAYAVVDAKLGVRLGKALIALTVFNVFDREYDESGGIGFAGVAFNPGPERSGLLSLEAEF